MAAPSQGSSGPPAEPEHWEAGMVAAAVLAQFESLPKSGKPQPHEHTVLAGIAVTVPPPAPSAPSAPPVATAAAPTAGGGSCQLPPPQQPHQHAGKEPKAPIVLALATGTKCLPASKRDPAGRALNDCHAEAACRRALLRWLYCEALEAVRLYRLGQRDGTAVLQLMLRSAAPAAMAAAPASPGAAQQAGGSAAAMGAPGAPAPSVPLPRWQLALRPGVRLHMYVSQPPCGDASILDGGLCLEGQCGEATTAGPAQQAPAAGAAEPAGLGPGLGAAPPAGQQLPASGLSLGRTGAKPMKRAKLSHGQPGTAEGAPTAGSSHHGQPAEAGQTGSLADGAAGAAGPAGAAGAAAGGFAIPQAHEVESYAEAQAPGLVRRKPGRGEATLSMSCSDKLARWRLLGLQGSLLSSLLAAPLHLSSLSVTLPLASPQPAPAAGAAAAAPGPAVAEGGGPAAAGGSPPPAPPATPAAAAEASLRRALLGRTAALAAQLPPPFGSAGALPLSLSIHCPVKGADWERLQRLGLVAGGARKVASGSSLLWHAPPSTQVLVKGGLKPWPAAGPATAAAAAAAAAETPAAGPGAAAAAAVTIAVVRGGTQEAVAGTTGVKLGHARKGAAPPPPAAAPGVCKAALLRLFWEGVGALASLPPPAAGVVAAEQHSGAGPGPAAALAPLLPAPAGCSYRQAKHAAGAAYQAAWRRVLEAPGGAFEGWIPKAELLEAFSVDPS